MMVDRVVFNGTVLASLYQETTGCTDGFDGLLFGQTHWRSKQTHEDQEEAQRVEERVSIVTAYVRSPSLCSFYNAAGEIDDHALRGMLDHSAVSDPLLGWLSFRSGPALKPSMRETCITHALAQVSHHMVGSSSPDPSFLCLLHSGKDHNEATISFGYRMFWLPTTRKGETPMPLGSIPVEVINMGANQDRQRYESFWPPLQVSSPSGSGWEASVNSLQSLNLASQIEQMEYSYNSMVKELQSLVETVRQGGARIDHMKSEVEKKKLSGS